MKWKNRLLAGFAAALGLAGMAGPAIGQNAGWDAAIRQGLDLADYSIVEIQPPAQPDVGFELVLSLGGVEHDVVLTPHSVAGPNYRVLAQDATGALVEVPPPPSTTYRGFIEGQPGATVAASLIGGGGGGRGGQLDAMILLGPGADRSWFIQPVSAVVPEAPKSAHVVYRASDGIPGPWNCGVENVFDDPGALAARIGAHPAAGGGGGVAGLVACELAIDADYPFFQKNGSSLNTTTADVHSIINKVSAIYEPEADVKMLIGTLIVRTTAAGNPYTSTNAGTLLGQFQTHWNSVHAGVPRDLAHLFTGVNLDGSTIGLAYLGVVCNQSQGYGLSESRFTTNISFRTALTAHEIGHSFNAQHCNQSPTVCNPCHIMCSAIGGCGGGLSTFGCSAGIIKSYAATKACLTPPPPPPPPTCYPNCDGNVTPDNKPILNVDDYICFQIKYAAQDPYADCDANALFTIDDLMCFQMKFAFGCAP